MHLFCDCSKKLLDQEEVSQVAAADQERGFTPEDVKLLKNQFSHCGFSTSILPFHICIVHHFHSSSAVMCDLCLKTGG